MSPPNLRDIFDEAVDLDSSGRAAYLDRVCAGDKDLLAEVMSLLEVYDRHPEEMPVPRSNERVSAVGRYSILGELGKGGMGRVYRALDPQLGREIALKVLPDHLVGDPKRFGRFRREARILARLNHPNVAILYSLEETDEAPFLTMEVVQGETLAEKIRRGPLSVEDTISICTQIVNALQAAHSLGIVHRDLKPSNAAVTADLGVKVFDFGLAKAMDAPGSDDASSFRAPRSRSPTLPGEPRTRIGTPRGKADDTLPGSILGSPGYMSPEQYRGDAVGPATDLWAVGCIAFECLTGSAAFPGAT
ncbi:MAG: protein kinase, partial [Candidatus Latescibacteria bacterium]|nr:protein kinase [Candidatus Latescibacterota bacterium]